MNYFKPISISLSPNVQKDDLLLALNLIIRPWLWLARPGTKGKAVEEIEAKFRGYLGVKYAVSFNSGRSAFYAILKALNLPMQSEVLLQAFTCNAVPNPVIWANLKPVYIDCNLDDFNMNVDDLKAKITTKSAAVVVQHTFGKSCNLDQIRPICSGFSGYPEMILIEDCAHCLGGEFNGAKLGSQSKAAFFSFSRDKIISSVYGGMAVTNDDKIGESLLRVQAKFGMPNLFWVFQQLLHPILLHYIILPIYNFLDLGKIFLIFAQISHVLSKAVSWKEKRGLRPDYFPKALPNAMAVLALNQFNKLKKFNAHRKEIADFYYENLKETSFVLPPKEDNIFLRFAVKHRKAHEIIYESWHKQNILLGDWYTTPIAPFDTKNEEIEYKLGSCKNAEALSKITLNLPTHINISKEDAERIVSFLKKIDNHYNDSKRNK